MARALWSGAISFGLVNVPVQLYRSTASTSAHSISFHQIHKTCGTRLQHIRRCPTEGIDDVPWEEVAKGYEFSKGRYAILDEEDLPKASAEDRAQIAIVDFVALEDVDPMYFDRTYWIAPEKQAAKAYALLLHALEKSGKIAVARVMLRTRSHLAAVRPHGKHLVMETMFFEDEMIPEEEIPAGAEGVKPPERELSLAMDLIERMSGDFEPSRYRDEYTDEVRQRIDEKIAKQKVTGEGPVHVGGGDVIDIMDALKRSLAQSETAAGTPEEPPRKKRATTHRAAKRRHGR